MKKINHALLVFLLLTQTSAQFSQIKPINPAKLPSFVKKPLKIIGHIYVFDKKSQDYIFMSLWISRGNVLVSDLKVTLNGTVMAASKGHYNYKGSKHGVTITVGTPIQVRVYSKNIRSNLLLASFSGKVRGIVRYAKKWGSGNTFMPQVPSSTKTKIVRIKWRFLGEIASPMKALRLYEYPGDKQVVYQPNPSGTMANFALSKFKTANTYKISLMKPQSKLLKPRGRNLDPDSFIGIQYFAEYEDAKTLLIY